MLVHQGTPEQGEELLRERWPDVPAIADPELLLYQAFELGRVHWSRYIGPKAMLPGLRAHLKGHSVGKPVGDVRVMSALVYCDEGAERWRHTFEHSGDYPSDEQMRAAVRG